MRMSFRVLGVFTSLIRFTLTQSSYYNAADSEFNQQSLFKCKEEGFHPDPRDCRVYYRCVDWGNSSPLTSFKFECGIGTVFSKNRGNICVHPNDSERSECGDLENEIDSNWEQTSTTALTGISSHFAGNENNAIGNYKCIQEGFMKDPRDCSKFYRCVKERTDQYVKYEFTCGPGTIWDQDIQVCNHPWGVSRKECRNSLSDVGIGTTERLSTGKSSTRQSEGQNGIPGYPSYPTYPNQPGQSAYPSQSSKPNFPEQPNNPPTPQQPSTYATPASSILPPKPEINDSHENTGTTGRPGMFNKPVISVSQPTTTTLGTSGRPVNSVTSGESEVATVSGSCSQEGFFSDSQNCRKFYRCVNEGSGYTKYEFQCGTGTGWDSKLQTCNHLYLLPNCNGSIDTSDKNNESHPSINQDTSTTRQTNYQSPTSLATAPATSSLSPTISSTYLPPNAAGSSTPFSISTESSSTSLTTTSKVSSLPSTISSTYLPPTITGSSTPSYEIASNTLSTSGSSFSTSPQNPSQTSENAISSLTTSSSTSSLPLTGSTKPGSTSCQEDGFFPNIDDCRKFYRCVRNSTGYRRFEFDCGPGTAWDQGLQTCNYISQVSTCQSASNEIEQGNFVSSKPPISEVSPMMTTSTPNENIDKPSTTTQLQEVSSPVAITESPPSSSSTSEFFTSTSTLSSSESSEVTESTDNSSKPSSENANCSTPKSNNKIVCNIPGFYAHPTRCDKFYRCVDNGNGFNVYHFDCPPGTIFDPSISVCNYPESVYPERDCSSGIQSSTSSSTAFVESSTSSEEMQESATTVNFTENTTAKEDSGSQESTTTSETTGSSVETTNSETMTTDSSSESSTSEPGNESTETTVTSSEVTSQTEDGSVTTVSSEIVSTQTSILTTEQSSATTEQSSETTEQSSATTELSSETSTSQETITTTQVMQETTVTDSTEQSNTGQETTTESQGTTSDSMSQEPVFANCPIAANLTDEQVLLVCPTGFKRHPKFCNLLYQCTSEGNMQIKILTLSCPENTIFDEMKVQCVPETESSEPCMGSTSLARFYRRSDDNSLSPVKISSQRICQSEGHYPFREGCSSTFYKCKNNSRGSLQGYLYKCPKDFVYWSVSRRCERATRLPMCSRLGYTTQRDSWESLWEVPIEDNNLSARMLYFE